MFFKRFSHCCQMCALRFVCRGFFLHYLIKKHGQFNEFWQLRHQEKLMIWAMEISFTSNSSFFHENVSTSLLSSPTLYTLLNNAWITLYILKLYLNKSIAYTYTHTHCYTLTHNSFYQCNYLKFFMYASNIHSFSKL